VTFNHGVEGSSPSALTKFTLSRTGFSKSVAPRFLAIFYFGPLWATPQAFAGGLLRLPSSTPPVLGWGTPQDTSRRDGATGLRRRSKMGPICW
jgi:hypothetical protein